MARELGWRRASSRLLATGLIAVAIGGCSTLAGQSPYSMAEPDMALGERTWGEADQADTAQFNQSAEGEWTTRVYPYRGGRDPTTGLAKIQM